MTKKELFHLSVDLTAQFIANRDLGGRVKNPEDQVHDCIVSMYQTLERAWVSVDAEACSSGK